MKKVKQSFTLIEILVVIVIIGILSSFIFFTINDSVEKAQIAKSKMFSESIRNNLLLNLVSEWKLNGDANDSWGSNNGTWHGSSGGDNTTVNYRPASECISGQCLDLDGTDDYINYGTILNNFRTNDFTVSVWVKLSRDSAYRAIFAKGCTSSSDFLLYKPNSGILRVYCNAGTIDIGTSDWTDNKWINIVTTRKNALAKLYINNQFKGEDNTAGADLNNTHTWNIGAAENGTTRFFNGLIDEVQIYDAAIPGAQIKQNYLIGLNNLYAKGLISDIEYNNRLGKL